MKKILVSIIGFLWAISFSLVSACVVPTTEQVQPKQVYVKKDDGFFYWMVVYAAPLPDAIMCKGEYVGPSFFLVNMSGLPTGYWMEGRVQKNQDSSISTQAFNGSLSSGFTQTYQPDAPATISGRTVIGRFNITKMAERGITFPSNISTLGYNAYFWAGNGNVVAPIGTNNSPPNQTHALSALTSQWQQVYGDTALPPADNLGVFDPQAGIPSTLPPVVQSVTPAGTATNLSLSSRMKFDSSISGQQGSLFVGARVPPYATASGLTGGRQAEELRQPQDGATESWYVSNGASWGPLGDTIPAHFTGPLTDANAVVNILNGANTAGLCGTEFYVGYGANSSAMLTNRTLGKVYTVMCNFDFTGSASGSSSGLTLTASAQVATADAGKNGNFYVGRLLNSQWVLHNGSGWVAYSGGAIPAYVNGVLSSRQIPVFNNENVQSLTGAQIFAGYGLDDADLLANNKYKLVHTIQ